ncbi:LAQU0S04e02564g1_1 [Lachancea quebecensis]|uniref:LAQU0S04e02564g1_1 n=1 Tax=Lachancea quebecensis TaxID=1654605 RepID=A0A0P1KPI6_9SACH|nr:LAQU0S04e02564g1_1 [Lachancea quebecensis]
MCACAECVRALKPLSLLQRVSCCVLLVRRRCVSSFQGFRFICYSKFFILLCREAPGVTRERHTHTRPTCYTRATHVPHPSLSRHRAAALDPCAVESDVPPLRCRDPRPDDVTAPSVLGRSTGLSGQGPRCPRCLCFHPCTCFMQTRQVLGSMRHACCPLRHRSAESYSGGLRRVARLVNESSGALAGANPALRFGT